MRCCGPSACRRQVVEKRKHPRSVVLGYTSLASAEQPVSDSQLSGSTVRRASSPVVSQRRPGSSIVMGRRESTAHPSDRPDTGRPARWKLRRSLRGVRLSLTAVTAALMSVTTGAQRSGTAGPHHVLLATDRMMPPVTRQVAPEYPDQAIAAGIEGDVVLEVVVDARGRVAQVRVAKSPDPDGRLDRAALNALEQWRCRPATTSDGDLVAVLVLMRCTFNAASQRASAALIPPPRDPLPARDPRVGQADVYTDDRSGLLEPTLIRGVRPQYTTNAMRQKIMGVVELEVVVLADGTPAQARVVRSLDRDSGLDREALIAARYWLFEPARLEGRAGARRVTLELEFRLH
jgi:TonB family protein